MGRTAAVPMSEPDPMTGAAPTRRWVTQTQALEIVPVSRRTFDKWILSGKLPVYHVDGVLLRFFRIEDIEALLLPGEPNVR